MDTQGQEKKRGHWEHLAEPRLISMEDIRQCDRFTTEQLLLQIVENREAIVKTVRDIQMRMNYLVQKTRLKLKKDTFQLQATTEDYIFNLLGQGGRFSLRWEELEDADSSPGS